MRSPKISQAKALVRFSASSDFLGAFKLCQHIRVRVRLVAVHSALCYTVEHMRTATVRELRNRYAQLLRWLDAGEEIVITRRGVTIARLVPEKARTKRKVNWKESAAFQLDRLKLRPLTAQESAEMLELNRGPY